VGGGWVVGCRGGWVVGGGSWVVGRGSWVVGRGAWGMRHGVWGMGHGAWGMGHGALGTFIPGSLGTSLAVCRDNKKYGGSVTRKDGEVVLLFSVLYQQFTNAKSSRGIEQVLSFVP